MSGRGGGRWAVSAALLGLLVLCFTAVGASPVESAFSAKVTDAGESLTAAADFETGRLRTWGGTYADSGLPLRIGGDSDWAVAAPSTASLCAVKTTGTLWCSGTNAFGQLGQGDTVARTAMTQVGSATSWTSVQIGNENVCALRSGGTLWCWGRNAAGNVGNGTTANQTSPVQVTSPAATGWSQVTVAYGGTCALRTDTSLWCWGENSSSQLGDGSTTDQSTPTRVTSPAATGWAQVSSGDRHTCALRTGGQLWCWGANTRGELGQGGGGTASMPTPVQVPGSTWASVSTAFKYTCATKTDRTLWCWGINSFGQLGIGTTVDVSTPTQVGSATTYRTLSAGQQTACADRTDDTLWCWGYDGHGSVGDGARNDRAAPVEVVSPATTGWAKPALGLPADRSCSVRAGGQLWCWGYGFGDSTVPVAVDSVTTWRRAASGADFTCALRTPGELYCWGVNTDQQLGDGTGVTRTGPQRIGTGAAWTSVAAGQKHACAIQADTSLWCWGLNSTGQLGLGSTTTATTPTRVTSPSATGWAQVSAGSTSTCATRSDGSLYCWGANGQGELGNGSTTASTTPVQVTAFTDGWTSITLGRNFACGQRSTTLYCWGLNSVGQLGNGTAISSSTPSTVSGSWASSTAGTAHTCAVSTASTLWCWGSNANGRLGDGSTTSSMVPIRIGTAADWRTASAGFSSTCGTRTGPTTWCWGQNQYGQLGLGDTVDRTAPVQLPIAGRPVTLGSSSYSATLVSALG